MGSPGRENVVHPATEGSCWCGQLGNVESVKNEHVLVVLGQRHDVALRGDLEAAAAAHLHVRTLELADERAVALEHGDVEPVAVAVADQHVAGVADVDAVWVVGDVLTADAVKELAVPTEHHHTVPLPATNQQPPSSVHHHHVPTARLNK